MNLVLGMRGKGVRASVHPTGAIEQILSENALSRHVSKSVGPAWQVEVYGRL
jgi:hypothetical protein